MNGSNPVAVNHTLVYFLCIVSISSKEKLRKIRMNSKHNSEFSMYWFVDFVIQLQWQAEFNSICFCFNSKGSIRKQTWDGLYGSQLFSIQYAKYEFPKKLFGIRSQWMIILLIVSVNRRQLREWMKIHHLLLMFCMFHSNEAIQTCCHSYANFTIKQNLNGSFLLSRRLFTVWVY